MKKEILSFAAMWMDISMSSEIHQAQKCKTWTFSPHLKAKNCQAGCRVLTEVREDVGKDKRLDVIVSNTNLNQ